MMDVDETFRLWGAKPDAPPAPEPIPALAPDRRRRALPSGRRADDRYRGR